MNKQFTNDKQISEQLLLQEAKKLYRDIEDYIARYKLYVDISDDLVDFKHYLFEHFIK